MRSAVRPIVTLTPNPSLDRTLHLPHLQRGAVLRTSAAALHPSGKGLNVSRALAAHGRPNRAVLPLGGIVGEQLRRLAEAEGVELAVVPIAASVRSNVSVVEQDGTVTKLNEPGPCLLQAELTALLAAVADAAAGAAWIAGCGSLPPHAPVDLYAQLLPIARAAGAQVAVDSSGAPLLSAVEAGVDLVKPNLDELAEAIGRRPARLRDALAGAEQLRERGATAVLLSLGGDGALLVEESGCLHGEAPVAAPASTVGAGDALLAGFLAAGGRGADALAEGLAWAAAACRLSDSAIPTPADLDRGGVVIHSTLALERPLASANAR